MAEAEREARLTGWVRTYSDALLRLCFLQLRDYTLCEDALQETFIKAGRAMPKYEHGGIQNDRAWLCRIALNVCHDIQRSRWMRHVDAARALESLPPALFAVEPEDRTLLLDVMNLPEKFREVILLYHYQRLSMRDIAKVLHIDVSTVHARLKKAEGLLKQVLTEEVDGHE